MPACAATFVDAAAPTALSGKPVATTITTTPPSSMSAADIDRCLVRLVLLRQLDRLELSSALATMRDVSWSAMQHVDMRDASMLALAMHAARAGDIDALGVMFAHGGK